MLKKRSLCEAAEFHGAQALSIDTLFCSKICPILLLCLKDNSAQPVWLSG